MFSTYEIWCIYVIFYKKTFNFYIPKRREIFNKLIQHLYKIQLLYTKIYSYFDSLGY